MPPMRSTEVIPDSSMVCLMAYLIFSGRSRPVCSWLMFSTVNTLVRMLFWFLCDISG